MFHDENLTSWLDGNKDPIKDSIIKIKEFFTETNRNLLSFAVEYFVSPVAVLRVIDSDLEMIGYVEQLIHQMKSNMSATEIKFIDTVPEAAGVADHAIERRRMKDFSNPLFTVAFLFNPFLHQQASACWNQVGDVEEDDESEEAAINKFMNIKNTNKSKSDINSKIKNKSMSYKKSFGTIATLLCINKEEATQLQFEMHQYLNLSKPKYVSFISQVANLPVTSPSDVWSALMEGRLKDIAIKVLQTSIRQSPVERYFSQRTVVVGTRRRRIKTGNEEKIVAGKIAQAQLASSGHMFSEFIRTRDEVSSTSIFQKLKSKELSLADWKFLANCIDGLPTSDSDSGSLASTSTYQSYLSCSSSDDLMENGGSENENGQGELSSLDTSSDDDMLSQTGTKRQRIGINDNSTQLSIKRNKKKR